MLETIDIHFTIHVHCGSDDPGRVVLGIDGKILDYTDKNGELGIGNIQARLIQRSRTMDERISLFVAMDSIDQSVSNCYEALFDVGTDRWNHGVVETYGQPMGLDVLYIESIELEEFFRGVGIGAQVVRETIATFASCGVGLVVLKPFPLQYSGCEDPDGKLLHDEPGFEERRRVDFARLANYWSGLGFRKLPNSDFYAYAPELIQQPDPPRGRRGRRKARAA